jgi:hypothetical protein
MSQFASAAAGDLSGAGQRFVKKLSKQMRRVLPGWSWKMGSRCFISPVMTRERKIS